MVTVKSEIKKFHTEKTLKRAARKRKENQKSDSGRGEEEAKDQRQEHLDESEKFWYQHLKTDTKQG